MFGIIDILQFVEQVDYLCQKQVVTIYLTHGRNSLTISMAIENFVSDL